MKTTREKADELVEKHINEIAIMLALFSTRERLAIEHDILSVKHTIEVLEVELLELSKNRQENEFLMWVLESLIEEQTELLTELESRL